MSTKNYTTGTTPDTLAAGDDPRLTAVSGKATKGANTDITSLGGLTTPLSVAQGGTGSVSQNFVDLSTAQTVAGAKTFSSTVTASVNVATPIVNTTGNSLTFTQTGDQFGATSFQLLNRNNYNGMFVSVATNDLADIILAGSSGVASNVRFEHRSASLVDAGQTAGEFQIGSPSGGSRTGSWINIGANSTTVKATLGVNLGSGTAPNSTLQVNGSISLAYVAKTAAYTVAGNDHTIDCTSGTFTVTLPTATSAMGREYLIKNSGTGTITVGTTSSQTIDGATSVTLNTQYARLRVQSTNANWIITG